MSKDDKEEQDTPSPWEVTDRGRGILTQNDREYLMGQKEIEGQDERNTRYRIRQRVVQSLLDLALLDNLKPDDVTRIFSDERLSDIQVRRGAMAIPFLMARYGYIEDTDELASEMESLIEETVASIPPYGAVPSEVEGDEVPLVDYDASVSIELEESPVVTDELIKKALDVDSDTVQTLLDSEDEDVAKMVEEAIREKLEDG